MLRTVSLFGIFVVMIASGPAGAITPQQKMETCKFGADDQKLTGAERKAFITKCMANEKASSAAPKPQ
jgi:hypothetical protein